MFDHEVPILVNGMRNISVGVFEHLYITSKLDVYQNIKYNERTLIGPELNKYIAPLLAWKETAKDFSKYQWTCGSAKDISIGNFWVWAKAYGLGTDRDPMIGEECCKYFEKEFWFELGKSMQKKQRSNFHDHMKYINNNIVKTFREIILQYADRFHDMHNPTIYLPKPSKNRDIFDQEYWRVCNYEFTENDIRVANKDGSTLIHSVWYGRNGSGLFILSPWKMV